MTVIIVHDPEDNYFCSKLRDGFIRFCKMSAEFMGGVFSVSFYDDNGNYLQGWHRPAIHTVALIDIDETVCGGIITKLYLIWNDEGVNKIVFSFDDYTEYPDVTYRDISWYERL